MSLNRTFLNEIFLDQYPKGNLMPKNLRYNAREAAEYLTNLPYMDDPDAMRPVGRPGRGANGESAS